MHSPKRTVLEEKIEDFLVYLIDNRGYTQATFETYALSLQQMNKECEFYEAEGRWILDLTPFRMCIASLNKKSIATKLSAIHSFVRYLEDQHRMPIKLSADELIKVPQTLPKPIEENYILEVLNDSSSFERLLVMMLYGLGLRISELSQVKLEDIDQEWIQIHGKGGKVRQLPILPILQSLLDDYIRSEQPKKYLFEKNEERMKASRLRYIINKTFKSKGIKVTPHQLRHSFATHLLEEGARISDISELLGHRSMASTQIYTKLGNQKKLKEYLSSHPLVLRTKDE
jgi:integrase/recombinase XerC